MAMMQEEVLGGMESKKIEEEILPVPMDALDALKMYSQHFGENHQESVFNVTSLCNFKNASSPNKDIIQDDGRVCAQLQKDIGADNEDASDCGEECQFCDHCRLPIGQTFYTQENGQMLHGECLAQAMVRDMRNEDKARIEVEREQKKKRHEEYGIGWNVGCIPRNDTAAKKLVMCDVPQGMACIFLDEETWSIGVGATLEPAAAMNLEYLSTALQVRRREGHEPVFSLDPVSTEANAMQEKRFVPDWLAGTNVGDVLFQADYHLKELSMGEYDQPVVGMKSCFDYSELEGANKDWSAREWFMVRKAEVHISDNSVLRPYVKMGVEAREQSIQGNSLEDKTITRPDHPMVMYAEAFTKNFDLISERKSVIFHLRELAKASVIAKYLLDASVQLEDNWFNLATGTEVSCAMEVPQLWNERVFAKVNVEEGKVNGEQSSRMHGVYGGVRFGLDKFQLASGVSPGASLSAGMPTSRLAPGASLSALSAGLPTARLAPGASLSAGKFELAKGIASLSAGLPAHRLAPSLASGISSAQARNLAPGASLSAGMPTHRLAFGLSRKAGLAPVSNIMSMASGAQFVPPSASLGAISSLTGAPRLATSIGMSPLRAGLAPPSAALSATIAPRLASQVSASIAAAPRLATSIGATIGTVPRLAASMTAPGSTIGAAPRLATSLMPPHRLAASISATPGQRLTASMSAKPVLATSIGASLGATSGVRSLGLGASLGSRPTLAASIGSFAPQRLQGVDLRLDSFDLSEAKHVASDTQEWGGELTSLTEGVAVGASFWSSLDNDNQIFKQEDKALLKEVFHPKLTDRRLEGDLFAPPDASSTYVTKLRALLRDEDSVRQKRRATFFSKAFNMDEPGSLFPFSWKSAFESSSCAEQRPHGALIARPEYKVQALHLLQDALRDSAPIFDKSTEEGLHFRVYILGCLEVRTVQEVEGEEVVGAVFSIQKSTATSDDSAREVQDHKKVAKATQYVERSLNGRHYYVVLETESGHKIRMELLASGKTACEVEPCDLEDRNSLAKVLHCNECKSGLLVGDMKAYQINLAADISAALPASCKRHAQNLLARTTGAAAAQAPRKGPEYSPSMLMSNFTNKSSKKIAFVTKK